MQLRCEECGSTMRGFERGWRGVRAGDPDGAETAIAFCHVALVAPNPLTLALVQQSLRYAAPLELRSRIFYSRADAVAWLGEATQAS